MQINLDPCPFCGGTNIDAAEVSVSGEHGRQVAAGCEDCGAHGPLLNVDHDNEKGWFVEGETIEKSAAAWNDRKGPEGSKSDG